VGVFVAVDGKQSGRSGMAELQAAGAVRPLTRESLVWAQGMAAGAPPAASERSRACSRDAAAVAAQSSEGRRSDRHRP